VSYNVQSSKFGVAFKPQTDLQTPNVSADFWRLGRINGGFASIQPRNESDAQDSGKGSEFATRLFPIGQDVSLSFQKRLSSEWAAWVMAFAMTPANMTVTPDGAGSHYTFTPADACDGIDLPSFSVVEQLGDGCPGGAAIDRMAVGCVVNGFKFAFTNGTERNNTTLSADFSGTGQISQPSGIVLPATLIEHEIRNSSASVLINGINYVDNKSLLSLEADYTNNPRLQQGYFIGSGVSAEGFPLRGRMERGDRAFNLAFTARLAANSPELAALKSGTQSSTVITLSGADYDTGKPHKVVLTYPLVQFASADIADDQGLATVRVTATILEHPTLGIFKAEVFTTQATIGKA
jgi:hypothetical protein